MRVGIIRCLVFATIFLLTLAVIAQAQKAEQRIPYYATAEAGWQWPANSDGITYIPVCWENPQGYTTEEGWVKTRILNTWQAAANVSFYYWGACIPTYKGVHILITDTRSNSQIGRKLDGLGNGMELNFTFKNFSPSCQAANKREFCIESIAVHEFGHALGFIHEQNRTDSPCKLEIIGDSGWPVTDYDPESVMNYCNPRWNNDGQLSPKDIKGVQTLYGARTVTTIGNKGGQVYIGDELDAKGGQVWENIIVDFTNEAGKGSRQYFNVNSNALKQARTWNFFAPGKYCYQAWSYTMYTDKKERKGYGKGCFTLSGGSNYTFSLAFAKSTYSNMDFNINLIDSKGASW